MIGLVKGKVYRKKNMFHGRNHGFLWTFLSTPVKMWSHISQPDTSAVGYPETKWMLLAGQHHSSMIRKRISSACKPLHVRLRSICGNWWNVCEALKYPESSSCIFFTFLEIRAIHLWSDLSTDVINHVPSLEWWSTHLGDWNHSAKKEKGWLIYG